MVLILSPSCLPAICTALAHLMSFGFSAECSLCLTSTPCSHKPLNSCLSPLDGTYWSFIKIMGWKVVTCESHALVHSMDTGTERTISNPATWQLCFPPQQNQDSVKGPAPLLEEAGSPCLARSFRTSLPAQFGHLTAARSSFEP